MPAAVAISPPTKPDLVSAAMTPVPETLIRKDSRPIYYLILFFCFIKVLVHFFANANYGLHADELYYIALSHHLQWGYLDNSPLIAVIARTSEILFGSSTFAWRIIPTIASALMVSLTGLMTYHMGGKRIAVSAACLGGICSPAYLATSYLMQPVIFDQLLWTAFAYSIVRYVQTHRQRFLYLAAVIIGLGILNKYITLMYVGIAVVSIIATAQRRDFRLKQIILPTVICLLIASPNLIWQLQNGIPIIKYVGIVHERTVYLGAGDYLFQLTFFHGAGMAVWLAGLAYLLVNQAPENRYYFAAIAFVLVVALVLILQGKIYYSLGAFPVLFAAGGVCWEKMLKKSSALIKYSLLALTICITLIALPIVLPILPFNAARYYVGLMRTYTSIDQPLRWEDGKVHEIPQFFADMLGWQDLAAQTTEACNLLTMQQRAQAAILTDSYPVAGALTHYGKELPPVISANNSFINWSPADLSYEYLIYISKETPEQVAGYAQEIKLVSTVRTNFASVNGMQVYLLDRPSASLKRRYLAERSKFLGNAK